MILGSLPLKQRSASVAPLVALLLVPLLGMMAFCLDAGLLLDNRRRCQTAADLAALAGATDMFINYRQPSSADPTTAAVNNVTSNGYSSSQLQVNLNSAQFKTQPNASPTPAVLGKYAGGQWQGTTIPKNYIEAILSYTQTSYFGRVFGVSSMNTQARAVARAFWESANPGILLLDPTSKASLDMTGNGTVTITGNGSLVNNSTDPAGSIASGNGNIAATSYYFTGSPGYSTSGGGAFVNVNTGLVDNSIINSGVPPTPDPLAALPYPAQPPVATLQDGTTVGNGGINWSGNQQYGSGYYNTATGQFTVGMMNPAGGYDLLLNPGYYPGGFKSSANTGSNIYMLPGIYWTDGGFITTGGAGITSLTTPVSTDTGAGVLFYNSPNNTNDVISLAGNGAVNIQAPTTGTYQGISIFQNRSASATVSITGNGNMNISGTFYAAGATLQITGNGSTTSGFTNNIGSQYVSKNLALSGNGSFNINYGGGNPIIVRTIQIVE
jgi:hypothetical protein